MSLVGARKFKENLDILMESKEFQKMSETEKWNLGYRFLNSNYGLGNFLGKVKRLKKKK